MPRVVHASAGQRNRQVLIEMIENPGEQWEQWEPMCFATMSRADLGADERFRSDQETAYADTRWIMPYRPDMDPELIDVPATRRLVYAGRVYDIRDASPMGLKRQIELTTLAKVG